MASKDKDDDDKKAADTNKQKTRDHTPGVVDKDDPYSDVSNADLDEAANTPAPDPVNHSVDPVPVTTIEDLGIGPRDPYPTGGTPPERDVYGNVIEKDEPDGRTRTKP